MRKIVPSDPLCRYLYRNEYPGAILICLCLEQLGVRFNFAGTIEKNGRKFHRFQVQVNAGKIPTSWKQWRQKHEKGTHGIVATVEIPDNGSEEEVQEALDAVDDQID